MVDRLHGIARNADADIRTGAYAVLREGDHLAVLAFIQVVAGSGGGRQIGHRHFNSADKLQDFLRRPVVAAADQIVLILVNLPEAFFIQLGDKVVSIGR